MNGPSFIDDSNILSIWTSVGRLKETTTHTVLVTNQMSCDCLLLFLETISFAIFIHFFWDSICVGGGCFSRHLNWSTIEITFSFIILIKKKKTFSILIFIFSLDYFVLFRFILFCFFYFLYWNPFNGKFFLLQLEILYFYIRIVFECCCCCCFCVSNLLIIYHININIYRIIIPY